MKANWLSNEGQLGETIAAETLRQHGVLHEQVDATDDAVYQQPLDVLKAERGYPEQDIVELSPQTPGLDGICAKFVDEHYHDDDEVRFVLSGDGIFDIRSDDDRWMRVYVATGDLIVVPAKRHHRFLLTDRRAIRCVRLFRDASGWVPHYRDQAAQAANCP